MPVSGSSVLRDLDLTARVAHGGMASIYVAKMELDGALREVAVKVLHSHLAEDPQIRRMFLHEASLAHRLRHPNVVHVYEHGEDPAIGVYMVMEYVRGADLAGVLRAAGERRYRIDPRVVARLAIDLCRGLRASHTLCSDDGRPLRLVHRDVSPHNILVGDDGVARLTDFGIAKSDERYTMTRPGQLKGKLSYMAPEQLAHEDDPDQRVDVFAAGVVTWEALLTKRLFRADDEVSTINKVLLARVEMPSRFYAELSPLDPVLERALAREPDERFSSAAEMADAIEAACEELGGVASREACQAELRELLEAEMARRAERSERASLTPTAGRSDSLTLDANDRASLPPDPALRESTPSSLTPREPERLEPAAPYPTRSDDGRWVGLVIALLLLVVGASGTAIAWIVMGGAPEPDERVAPASEGVRAVAPSSPTPHAPTLDAPAPPEAAPPIEPSEAVPATVLPRPSRARAPSAEPEAEVQPPVPAVSASSDGLPPMEGTPNPYGD